MATTQEKQRSTTSTQATEKHSTPKPQEEHRWLQKLVGDWTYEGEAPMKPGEAPVKFSGTETVRKIGELWVLGEGRGVVPGGEEGTSIIALGYDPQKQAFVGTWFGSMMNQLWVYEGELDAGKRKLTLNTEGPNMQKEGELANYREVIELPDDDRRTFTSFVEGEDGSWQQIMTTTYRRKGSRTN